jgi:hypothetical protein
VLRISRSKKRNKLQGLQATSKINEDNLNNMRCETAGSSEIKAGISEGKN